MGPGLRFIYQVPYGRNDPLFGKDIGFYLFSLPVWIALKNWMLLCWPERVDGRRGLFRAWRHRSGPLALAHFARRDRAMARRCWALWFAVKAWSYALDRFLLLYNDNGVVVGASYTDVHVELPVLWLLVGLAVVAAIVAWANVWRRVYRPAIAAAALVFGGSFVLAEVVPGLFERFYVKPSELQLEAPYIRQQHRPHPGGLQSAADRGEAVPGGTGSDVPVAARTTAAPSTISGCGTGSR